MIEPFPACLRAKAKHRHKLLWVVVETIDRQFADNCVWVCSNSTTPDMTLRYSWRMPLWFSRLMRMHKNTFLELCIM